MPDETTRASLEFELLESAQSLIYSGLDSADAEAWQSQYEEYLKTVTNVNAEPEPGLPEGVYGRIELPGYRAHTGWITDETRFGVQMAVARDWEGREMAAAVIGPNSQVVYLPTPLKRPEPPRALGVAVDAWDSAEDSAYDDDGESPAYDEAERLAVLMPDQTSTKPTRFRVRDADVDAMQWTGGNARQIGEWLTAAGAYDQISTSAGDGVFAIHTPDRDDRATPGDWIIEGVTGRIFVWPASFFEASYEPVMDLGYMSLPAELQQAIEQPQPAPEAIVLRAGRTLSQAPSLTTLYRVRPGTDRDADIRVGIVDSPELAEQIVAAVAAAYNAPNWGTSCVSCARLLDASLVDCERIERAEEERAGWLLDMRLLFAGFGDRRMFSPDSETGRAESRLRAAAAGVE